MKISRNKGITLVALIITIIILLILAGITIGQLTGSGLFENAKTAKERYENAADLESSMLSEYENAINGGYTKLSTEQVVDGNRDDITITMTENQLRNLIQEEINKNQYVYPNGTRVTLDSGEFQTIKTTTAPDDGWVVLSGYLENTSTKGLFLSVGNLMQAFSIDESWTLAASLPCRKGDTIKYQLYDAGNELSANLYFIPMNDNDEN